MGIKYKQPLEHPIFLTVHNPIKSCTFGKQKIMIWFDLLKIRLVSVLKLFIDTMEVRSTEKGGGGYARLNLHDNVYQPTFDATCPKGRKIEVLQIL